jgi:hypothetical protein
MMQRFKPVDTNEIRRRQTEMKEAPNRRPSSRKAKYDEPQRLIASEPNEPNDSQHSTAQQISTDAVVAQPSKQSTQPSPAAVFARHHRHRTK